MRCTRCFSQLSALVRMAMCMLKETASAIGSKQHMMSAHQTVSCVLCPSMLGDSYLLVDAESLAVRLPNDTVLQQLDG
ncbi:hypothetical protein BJX70DRAFT_154676 [Aspergillus crustosus]